MGQDQVTGEVVALKRINTEAEENGFPITAIREVKILKGMNHDNIVRLKEIVTSKGESNFCCSFWGGGEEYLHRVWRINLFVHIHPSYWICTVLTAQIAQARHYFGISIYLV